MIEVQAEVADLHELPVRFDAADVERMTRVLRLQVDSEVAMTAKALTAADALRTRDEAVAERLASLTRNQVGRRIEFSSPKGVAGKYHVELSCNGRDFSAPLTHWHSTSDHEAGSIIVVEFYDPASWFATAVSPACGMAGRATTVRVRGSGFVNTSRIVVRFGDVGDVGGTFDEKTGEIVAVAPETSMPVDASVLVSSGDGIFCGAAGLFRFYTPPSGLEMNLSLLPKHAPSAVVTRGRGIFPSSTSTTIFCPHRDGPAGGVRPLTDFDEYGESKVVVSSSFMPWRDALLQARAVLADANGGIDIDDEDGQSALDEQSVARESSDDTLATTGVDALAASGAGLLGAVQCLSPLGMTSDRVDVYVSLDGFWYTRVGQPLLLYSIDGGSPSLGPVAGGTCLKITGTNLDAVRELQAATEAEGDVPRSSLGGHSTVAPDARPTDSHETGGYAAVVRFAWTIPGAPAVSQDVHLVKRGSQRKPRHGEFGVPSAESSHTASTPGKNVVKVLRVQGVFNGNEVMCYTPPCPSAVLEAARGLASAGDARAAAAATAALMATVELSLDGGRSYTADGHKFRYYEPPVVGSLSPEIAAAGGGTRVVVSGSSFATDVPAFVRILDGLGWSVDVPAVVTSDSSLSFFAPEYVPSPLAGGTAAVLVSLNCQQWSGTGCVPEPVAAQVNGPRAPSGTASRASRPVPNRRIGGASDTPTASASSSALVSIPPAVLCFLPGPAIASVFPHVGTRTMSTKVDVCGRYIAVADCTSVHVVLSSGHSIASPASVVTAILGEGSRASSQDPFSALGDSPESSMLPQWLADLPRATSGDQHAAAALAAYAAARAGSVKPFVPGTGRREAQLRGPMFRAQSVAGGAVGAGGSPRSTSSRAKSRHGSPQPTPPAVVLHSNFVQVCNDIVPVGARCNFMAVIYVCDSGCVIVFSVSFCSLCSDVQSCCAACSCAMS